MKFGAPRDTDHPELRQPLALEIWDTVTKSLDLGSKITILTNGPLTSLAKIISWRQNTSSLIQVSRSVFYDFDFLFCYYECFIRFSELKMPTLGIGSVYRGRKYREQRHKQRECF